MIDDENDDMEGLDEDLATMEAVEISRRLGTLTAAEVDLVHKLRTAEGALESLRGRIAAHLRRLVQISAHLPKADLKDIPSHPTAKAAARIAAQADERKDAEDEMDKEPLEGQDGDK